MTQLTKLVKDMYTNQRENGQSKRASGTKQPFLNTAAYSTQHRSYTCFKCNNPDHGKRKCSWNGSGNISSQSVCQLSSQNGHIATQCNIFSQAKMSSNIKQNGVKYALKTGYSAPQCVQLQQGIQSLMGSQGTFLQEVIGKCYSIKG